MSAAEYSFDGVWDVLEKHGLCDARGSHEYWRVLELWKEQGEPADVALFVMSHANLLPVWSDKPIDLPWGDKPILRWVEEKGDSNGTA